MSNRRVSSPRKDADAVDRDCPEMPNAATRQRQLWNFLTWSFFLSQVLAAEAFMGSAAHAGGEGEDSRTSTAASDTPMPGVALSLAGVDSPASESALAPQGNSELVTVLDRNFEALPDGWHEGVVQAAESVPSAAMTAGGMASAAGDGAEPSSGAMPDAPSGAALENPADGLGGLLGDTLAPVLGTVGGVLGTVESLVDHLLSPLAGSVGDVVELLGDTLEHTLTPVVSTVSDVVGDVIGSLDGVVGDTLAPLLGVGLGPLAALELLGPSSLQGEPASQAAGVALDSLDAIVAPLAQVADMLGVVSSPGSIVLPEAPALAAQNADDLFSKGAHTAYNLAINSVPVAQAALAAADDLLDGLSALPVLDPGSDGHGTPHSQHGVTQHALEELHLRGFNEGIAL